MDAKVSRRALIVGAGVVGAGAAVGGALALRGPESGSQPAAQSSAAAIPTNRAPFLSSYDIHRVHLDISDEDYQFVLDAWHQRSEKAWIKGTLTIDGSEFQEVGLRLKGNASLYMLDFYEGPHQMPWKIRLDKYIDGANHEGVSTLLLRPTLNTAGLQEALALDLLARTGLNYHRAAYLAFSVNDFDPTLRLSVEAMDETWAAATFTTPGTLYKADALGDWTYRGDEADAYEDDVFSIEAGEESYTPLIRFLDFVNNSTDEDFKADLGTYLDLDAFATYLGFEALVINSDTFSGGGNNSYLRYDQPTNQMTVIAWDHDGAFPIYGPEGDEQVEPDDSPTTNPLQVRYDSLLAGETLVAAETERLRAALFASGTAKELLQARTDLLLAKGGEWISKAEVTDQRDSIAEQLFLEPPVTLHPGVTSIARRA